MFLLAFTTTFGYSGTLLVRARFWVSQRGYSTGPISKVDSQSRSHLKLDKLTDSRWLNRSLAANCIFHWSCFSEDMMLTLMRA